MIAIKPFIYLVTFFICVPFWVLASNAPADLVELDFDELMQIEVTSVSKKSEKLSEAAAAVYVVTDDDIRRSGATNIPEALRLVPGVDVAQIDPNKWSVSIRGFSGRFANKLLVLIDGRSVYTPTHSGVYWEYFDYIMDDIARIEVIRGPGATLWGANAVNGVINIITREAGDTMGGSISVAAGNEYQGIGLRQAGSLSKNAEVRVYAKAKRLDESKDLSAENQDNGGDYLQTGFRLDARPSASQWSTVQGDLYRDDLREQHNVTYFKSPIVNADVNAKGGDLAWYWGVQTGLDSELSTSLSYDFYTHDDFKYNEDRQTVNLELQHQFSPFLDHELVWGMGYRWSQNKMDYSALVYGDNTVEYNNIWNLFMQDSLHFLDHNINLIIGAKLEGNSYTGAEFQPNIRVSWVPNEQLTWWSSISRAKRIPSQFERNFTLNYSLEDTYYGPVLVQVVGNDDFQSEQLDAYEMGIRWMFSPQLSFDLATFYNDYKKLRSYDIGDYTTETVDGIAYTALQLELSNNIKGYSQGGELFVTWQATNRSRFRFVYSLLDTSLEDTQSNDFSKSLLSMMSERTPKHQVSLWSSFDLFNATELDCRLYYTGKRRWDDYVIDERVDADLRLAWQATKSLSLSLIGHNLLHSSRQQYPSDAWPSFSKIERSVFIKGRLSW